MKNDLIIVDFNNNEFILDQFIFDIDSDNELSKNRLQSFFDEVVSTNLEVRIRKYKKVTNV